MHDRVFHSAVINEKCSSWQFIDSFMCYDFSDTFFAPVLVLVWHCYQLKSETTNKQNYWGFFIFKIDQSTCKKKEPQPKRFLKENSDIGFDFCRKSLEADVEFQEIKVNSLLEKVKSLGMFLCLYTVNAQVDEFLAWGILW